MNCCFECGVSPGELHVVGCDHEQCPCCGGQVMYCCCDACPDDRLVWTGYMPGEEEAVRLGYFRLPSRTGYIRCTPDTPGAMPDLNRFVEEHEWSRAQRCYVKRKSG
jgi:hypothetical protein